MRGTILGYDAVTGEGMLSGADGARYPVRKAELGSGVTLLRPGQEVDFELVDRLPRAIYPIGAPAQSGQTGEKSKIAAGLLALFLGGLGIHKFYLGYNGAGFVMLLVWVFGWLLIGIPSAAIGIIALIEAIIYFTKSDDDFYRTYVVGRRTWF